MCIVTPLLIASMAMSAAGTAVSVSASQKQGKAAAAAGAYNGAIGEINAASVYEASKQNADQIIASSMRMRATQEAQQASSGMVVGIGSAAQNVADTVNLASQDALVMMYQGIDGYIGSIEEGRLAAKAGRMNAAAAYTASWGSLLSGAGQVAGMYASALKTPSSTAVAGGGAPPAPPPSGQFVGPR